MGKDKHKHKEKDKDKDRDRDRHDKKKDKDHDKEHETEEEKRQRRLEKKAKKAEKEAEKQKLFMGYSNEANPWNDGRLTERFVWQKKEQKAGGDAGGVAAPPSASADKEKRAQLRAELERVKKAREERERERDAWEAEKERMEREREQLSYVEHQKRADEFHLRQAETRAAIRLQEGRAKPIDVLSFHLLLAEREDEAQASRARGDAPAAAEDGADGASSLLSEGVAAALGGSAAQAAEAAELLLSQLSDDIVRDPVNLFRGLTSHELAALTAELEERERLDDVHRPFWDAMLTVCRAESDFQSRRERERRTRYAEYVASQGGGGGGGGAEEEAVGSEASRPVGFVTGGLHESVARDVGRKLGAKSLAQLEEMRGQIEETIRKATRRQQRAQRLAGQAGPAPFAAAEDAYGEGAREDEGGSGGDDDDDQQEIDVDYWTGVLELLRVQAAKAKLRDVQRGIVERQRARMAARAAGAAGDEALPALGARVDEGAEPGGPDLAVRGVPTAPRTAAVGDGDEDGAEADGALGAADGLDEGQLTDDPMVAQDGRYSPPLVRFEDLDEKERRQVVSAEQDTMALEAERRRVAARFRRAPAPPEQQPEAGAAAATAATAGAEPAPDEGGPSSAGGAGGADAGASSEPPPAPTFADALVSEEARKGMGAGEAQFSFEFKLEQHEAVWHEKYKPRKPRYFNRVHTGYEWNKYNQTHYDHDNPPPKMVQGYKFNIFYPDLINRSSVPSYQLLPDPSGATDTCIIRFHAGPPYEDVAFKVVNREWELSHRRGFKFRFERGVLQLYFNFKRYRYRR